MARVVMLFEDQADPEDANKIGVSFRVSFDPHIINPESMTPAQSEALNLVHMYDEYLKQTHGVGVTLESSVHGDESSSGAMAHDTSNDPS